MRITVLGSGTSSGVPVIGCACPVCTSDDPRDVRLRCSVLVQDGNTRILIDTSSDFRQQMLRHNVHGVDAVIFTHHHFDHISGFDDLRAFNYHTHAPVECYAIPETIANLHRIFEYAFSNNLTPGTAAPQATIHEITPGVLFRIGGTSVRPVPLMHGRLEVMGFRIGGFAYCTDCNGISESSIAMLNDLDVLIIDALRQRSHPTHFSLDQAIAMATRIGANRTFFTHIAHEMLHAEVEASLPEGMQLAYDGLTLAIQDLPPSSRVGA